jgi:hypothetical protein
VSSAIISPARSIAAGLDPGAVEGELRGLDRTPQVRGEDAGAAVFAPPLAERAPQPPA